LSDIAVLLLAAGESNRFGLGVKKQWLWIGEEPLWLSVARKFRGWGFERITIAVPERELPFFRRYSEFPVVQGGATREETVRKALLQMEKSPHLLISDVARPCLSRELVERILLHRDEAPCVAPAITPPDTVVYQNETVDRSQVLLVQTPQLCHTETLKRALEEGRGFTDESSAIRALGERVLYVKGERGALKLTFAEDLRWLDCLTPPSQRGRSGYGFDVHPFTPDRPLYLCGLEIPHSHGLAGHSDADVALHALIDGLLGAAGFGDIGELFPDNDPRYKGISSVQLLKETLSLLTSCGFRVEQVDMTIMAERPKLKEFKLPMEERLSELLSLERGKINLKATTTEGLGFVGREEGIAATALVTLRYFDWSRR